MSKDIILRELTSLESMLDVGHTESGRMVNPRVFIIDSKIDLFETRHVVLNAIKKWIGLHPLLKCKIVKRSIEIENDSITKRYFALAPDSLFEKLDNVLFLESKSDLNNLDNNAWQVLFENELFEPLDSTNGPLWRLKILKINEVSNLQGLKYAVLFTAHHSITDGRNAYEIIKELLKIIEYENANLDIPTSKERQSIIQMECNYPNDPRFSTESVIAPYELTSDVTTEILVPDYIKPQNRDQSFNKSLSSFIFKTNNGDVYIKEDEIIEKRSKTFSRFKIFTFGSSIFNKLLQKCKKSNAKVTGCIEVIIALALQNVYRHFSGDINLVLKPKYSVTINLRPFLTPPSDYLLMGAWQSSQRKVFDTLNQYSQDSHFWSDTFWQLSKQQTQNLHDFLKTKESLSKKTINYLDNYAHKFEKGFRVRDVNSLYAITNIGAASTCATDSLNKIHIKEYYSGLSYTENEYWHLAFHSVSSINDRLFWCLCYNGYYVADNVANYWVQSILNIISLLTKDDCS